MNSAKQKQIIAEIKRRPAKITAEDVKQFGDISKLSLGTHHIQKVYNITPILYMLIKGNKFGYSSIYEPVNHDPDNLLNILIDQIRKSYTQEELRTFSYYLFLILKSEYMPEFIYNEEIKYVWQVLMRIFEEFDNYLKEDIIDIAKFAITTNNLPFLIYAVELGESRLDIDKSSFINRLMLNAISSRHHDMIEYLISKGADPIAVYNNPIAFQNVKEDPRMARVLTGNSHLLSSSTRAERAAIAAASASGKNTVKIVKNMVLSQAPSRRSHILMAAPAQPRAGAGGKTTGSAQPRAGAGGNTKGGSRRHRTLKHRK
jgi:hypothetical protein